MHRDLKPANVMIGDYGEVYVFDWGVAKVLAEHEVPAVGRSTGEATHHGAILGSPGYMAPEQIGNAAQADERSDIYALGVILFEILTLEPLHLGGTVDDLLDSTLRGADAQARSRAPERDVPPELDAICARATTARPASRFASVRELRAAL